MEFDPLKLENQLCFPLYAFAKEIVKLYKPFLDEINLTYTQYITMMVLWEHTTLTVKELGKHLYLDSGTLTPLLKKLEKEGLVSRLRSAEDEREVNVALTDKGTLLRKKAELIPAKMSSCINLPSGDLLKLHEIIHNMLQQIESKN